VEQALCELGFEFDPLIFTRGGYKRCNFYGLCWKGGCGDQKSDWSDEACDDFLGTLNEKECFPCGFLEISFGKLET
jgi:hypothetical protein